MCGRAAQTAHAIQFAANFFGVPARNADTSTREPPNLPPEAQGGDPANESFSSAKRTRDNYNLSPGMDAVVIWLENGELKMDRKVWGLVTKGGTSQHPLPNDSKARIAMHFAGLMYNARADTLFEKPTFSRLAQQRRSCIVVLDGYFEWKASLLAGGNKKQPYFVYSHGKGDKSQNNTDHAAKSGDPPYLVLAGLWTSVQTGISDEPVLDTFTILTTEACKQIEWLHHRMPVCIWNIELAKKWLENPSPQIHKEIDTAAIRKCDGFGWHAVTTDMSSVKFRGKEAIEPVKGPTSVASFFSKVGSNPSSPFKEPALKTPGETGGSKGTASQKNKFVGSNDLLAEIKPDVSSPHKRVLSTRSSSNPSKKAKINHSQPDSPKKGLITSFFQKKS